MYLANHGINLEVLDNGQCIELPDAKTQDYAAALRELSEIDIESKLTAEAPSNIAIRHGLGARIVRMASGAAMPERPRLSA